MALLWAVALSASSPSFARETLPAREVAQLQISLASRQRMLTQRMTKAMCLSLVGIEVQRHRAVAAKAADDFDAGMAGLIAGPQTLALPTNKPDKASEQLTLVSQMATGLTPSVRQVALGDLHSVPVRLIVQMNEPVMEQADKAVTQIMRESTEKGVSPSLVNTLNQLGRHQMKSQRIAKNACFIYVGLRAQNARADLQSDIERFSKALGAMLNGDPERMLLKPPTRQIANRLRGARKGWLAIEPVLLKAGDGGEMSTLDLLHADRQLDKINRALDEAIQLWFKHAY